jgi:FkbM family methyltransferase
MTDYSQHQEQLSIKEYFGEHVGTFLDVGAADGIGFSNVYQLLLDGWSGLSVEPETQTFRELVNNYEQFGNRSELALSVINSRPGFVTFYESGQLSTTSHEHMAKWEAHRLEHGYEWKPISHYAITLDMLLQQHSSRNFDFISVDLEGENLSVVTSTNWHLAPQCRLVCIEHDQNEQLLIEYMDQYGFELYKHTAVNLLMSRKL